MPGKATGAKTIGGTIVRRPWTAASSRFDAGPDGGRIAVGAERRWTTWTAEGAHGPAGCGRAVWGRCRGMAEA